MSDIVISVENLQARYGANTVLDQVSLNIERGSSFALLGPNGAGKTTLLSILSTLRRPMAGAPPSPVPMWCASRARRGARSAWCSRIRASTTG